MLCCVVLQVQQYGRFTELRVDERGLPGGLRDVQPGDCVVAFNKDHLFEIKAVGTWEGHLGGGLGRKPAGHREGTLAAWFREA